MNPSLLLVSVMGHSHEPNELTALRANLFLLFVGLRRVVFQLLQFIFANFGFVFLYLCGSRLEILNVPAQYSRDDPGLSEI